MSNINIGQRVGAAYNQASAVAAALLTQGAITEAEVSTKVDDLATLFVDGANRLERDLLEAIPSTPAQVAPTASAEAQIKEAFPGTTEQAFNLTIKGTSHGPVPAWLIDAARDAGVTEVWDNRGDLGPKGNRPHFKAVDGDVPFWPPKEGK